MRAYTDRHVSPDGRFLTIDAGDRTIRRISADTTKLTFDTRCIAGGEPREGQGGGAEVALLRQIKGEPAPPPHVGARRIDHVVPHAPDPRHHG